MVAFKLVCAVALACAAVVVAQESLSASSSSSSSSSSASASASSGYPTGTMISITNMDNSNMLNYILRFDPTNATAPLAMVDYEYYEDTTAGAIDLVRGRYLLMYELPNQIGYYNITTLERISVLNLPTQQLPDAMHYDAETDTIYLVEVGMNSFTICAVTAGGLQNCPVTVQGSYSYTADASTYDAANKKLYVQLQSMNSGQPLFVFDAVAGTISQPIPMIDLCQSMNVAVLPSGAVLTCVDFITNLLVSVDVTTGKFTELFALPGNPQPYTASIYNDPSTGACTFFAELENFFGQSHWASYDVATGKQLSTSPVDNQMQLQLPFYIPPNTF